MADECVCVGGGGVFFNTRECYIIDVEWYTRVMCICRQTGLHDIKSTIQCGTYNFYLQTLALLQLWICNVGIA